MHTGVAALDVEESLQFAFPCIQKRLLPLRIKRSHPPNMPGECALANKVGKRRLFQHGRLASGKRSRDNQRVEQIWRRNDVTDAYRWKQHLAQGAHVDDTLFRV